ncbi:adenylate kinase [candidate division WOR-3 bacterium]|nr:adenylate kinase [candidate division WOR-3 bacterium]
MRILLFGPPGVGKGTQADLLSKKYNFIKFSIGDILREEVSLNSNLGNKVESYLNRGVLVPNNIIFELVKLFLGKNKEAHILFDGFPRTLDQAKNLEKSLAQLGLSLDVALEMHLAEDEIIKRLLNRRYCPKCNRIYNYATTPPKINGVCDQCRTKLEKRSDDDANTIRKRLQVYEEKTHPLVDYYKSLSVYNQTDAISSPEEVFDKISKIIDGYINKE